MIYLHIDRLAKLSFSQIPPNSRGNAMIYGYQISMQQLRKEENGVD